MRITDLDTTRRYKAHIVATERLTADASAEDVRELSLDVDERDLEYRAGQSILVIIPGPHPFGHDEHMRLYTVADVAAREADRGARIAICVRRCTYVDAYSGERFAGIASNYLCDRRAGEELLIAGPYGVPFEVPDDPQANLLLFGLGTGIAPFRAFVRHIYDELGGWEGQVILFYGAQTGSEMLYMNERRDDFAPYLDDRRFRAVRAPSPRPHWDEPAAIEAALDAHSQEVWRMLSDLRTFVYVAGLEQLRSTLDSALAEMAGSQERWQRRKAEMLAGGRWTELLY